MRGAVVLAVVCGLLAGCASRVARPTPSEDASEGRVTTREKMPRTYLGEGLASFYGPGLHGQRTASGERFDQQALSAAHRTERFGACVKVVNMENGRSVEVRINDRGPFVEGRIIDVSRAAAKALGMLDKGLARVRLYRCGTRVSELLAPPGASPS
ncbi:septal ring lytic transglycosylase RlpA family protein [Myxococcaceae bacterium JPH2]|nr:septal ring lytic transglycosylase RlpA family protein [Myxococcaceae bacterium JPH2]